MDVFHPTSERLSSMDRLRALAPDTLSALPQSAVSGGLPQPAACAAAGAERSAGGYGLERLSLEPLAEEGDTGGRPKKRAASSEVRRGLGAEDGGGGGGSALRRGRSNDP